MNQLFGVKVLSTNGELIRQEWVSILPEKIPAYINRHEAKEGGLYQQIESQVVVDNLGWYATNNPTVFVKIGSRDLRRCHGWLYTPGPNNKMLRLGKHHHWYLNGEAVDDAPYILTKKVTYENH